MIRSGLRRHHILGRRSRQPTARAPAAPICKSRNAAAGARVSAMSGVNWRTMNAVACRCRHRGRWPQSAPRTRRPAAPACAVHRSFPRRGRAGGDRRDRALPRGEPATTSRRARPSSSTSILHPGRGTAGTADPQSRSPSTASPRNSSDSLSMTPPLTSSLAREVCVSACSSSPGSRKRVADAALQVRELVTQRNDAAARPSRAVAVDEPPGLLRILRAHGNPDVGVAVHRERKNRPRQARRHQRRDAVAFEQAADDARLDVGRRSEHDGQLIHRFSELSS